MENLLGKIGIKSIDKDFAEIFRNKMNAEFALSTSEYFDDISWQKKLNKAKFKDRIKVVHLPFFGLNLGSKEIMIRKISRDIIKKGIDFSLNLNVNKGVLHTGYVPLIPKVSITRWLDKFYFELENLLNYSSKNNFTILLENTYEKDIDLFKLILNKFNDDNLKMCLDIAHVNCFSNQNYETWFRAFQTKIVHFHLSDNNGKDDEHLALGKGNIDYSLLPFNNQNLTFTFETKSETWKDSIEFLTKKNLSFFNTNKP